MDPRRHRFTRSAHPL